MSEAVAVPGNKLLQYGTGGGGGAKEVCLGTEKFPHGKQPTISLKKHQ